MRSTWRSSPRSRRRSGPFPSWPRRSAARPACSSTSSARWSTPASRWPSTGWLHDHVELSNLNRQILFGSRAVGRAKVDETARWIRRFDERIAVTCVRSAVASPFDVACLLDGVDVVVLVADHPPHELACWVNEACMAAGVPFVTAGQHLPIVRVGPTYVPGRTACFACHARQLRQESPLYDAYVAHARDVARPDATLGCTSGLAGSMLSTDLLRLLLSGSSVTAGCAVILDITTFEARREEVARDPGCGVCQHLEAWQSKATPYA
jgi:bacteriocin biosynthesis cyclodehydratase domain-containing protein